MKKLNPDQMKSRKEAIEILRKVNSFIGHAVEMHLNDIESEFPSVSAKKNDTFIKGMLYALEMTKQIDHTVYMKIFFEKEINY